MPITGGMTELTPGAHLDTLQKQLKACWMQGCTDLGALVGQPLKFRSEDVESVDAAALASLAPAGSLIAPLSMESEPGAEIEVLFTPKIVIVLAGVLNVQRPEEIATRLEAGTLDESDGAAVGELANILASAFEEPLKTALGRPLRVTRGELRTVAERTDAWQAAEPQACVVQRLTLAVAGMGEGEVFLILPAELGRELAGGAFDDAAVSADAAPAARPAQAAPRRAAPRPAEGFDNATPRVLVAGPVAQDTSEVEQVFVLQGSEVIVAPRLREIGVSIDPHDFTLIVLVIPPGSLSALPLIRALAALPEGPSVAVATRSATPSLVFQSARAGAEYVVVLPPSDAAAERLAELSRQPRRAAAA